METPMNPIEKLTQLGQSLWYDNIQRKLLETGELEAMIRRGDIRGVTSNPTIFQNAIANSSDYDAALIPLAWAGWDAEKIFWQLAVEDIQQACDLFRPLYEETKGGDGYVSLEVSPYLAKDAEGTVKQAKELWERVNRPNLMIKIPATQEGVPAVRRAIAAGINVNVTLIFSLERYGAVMEAYIAGLEDRVAQNKPVNMIASVASFFVSRYHAFGHAFRGWWYVIRTQRNAWIHALATALVVLLALWLRLLAREGAGLALVPPVVVKNELERGLLAIRHRIPEIRERFYAITPSRRFPNPLVGELLAGFAKPR